MSKNLNTNSHKVNTGQKKIRRCWNCRYNNKDSILDEYGCCQRCGTNLKKYPTRKSHRYPDMTHLEEEVLGFVDKCDVSDSAKEENDW